MASEIAKIWDFYENDENDVLGSVGRFRRGKGVGKGQNRSA